MVPGSSARAQRANSMPVVKSSIFVRSQLPPLTWDIHAAVPGFCLLPQGCETGDAATAETLPREDPDFDLRLIKPASVSGRVMDGEAIPDFCGHFRPEDIRQRLTAVDVEVVHYQVDRFRFRVRHRQGDGNLSELKPRT